MSNKPHFCHMAQCSFVLYLCLVCRTDENEVSEHVKPESTPWSQSQSEPIGEDK